MSLRTRPLKAWVPGDNMHKRSRRSHTNVRFQPIYAPWFYFRFGSPCALSLPMLPSPTPRNQSPTGKVTLPQCTPSTLSASRAAKCETRGLHCPLQPTCRLDLQNHCPTRQLLLVPTVARHWHLQQEPASCSQRSVLLALGAPDDGRHPLSTLNTLKASQRLLLVKA